jgi:hypothetical protein
MWRRSVLRYVATVLKGFRSVLPTFEPCLTRCFRQRESIAAGTHMGVRSNCKRILVFSHNISLLMHQQLAGWRTQTGS